MTASIHEESAVSIQAASDLDDSAPQVASRPALHPVVPATGDPAITAPTGQAGQAGQAGHELTAEDWRLHAWRDFLRAHAHLMRHLEQDLMLNGKIAMASYDVLVQLTEAPGYRLRMSDLADAVLLSRSGLTRLVDRLQREGFVRREPDPDDARGLFTVLTPAGRDALRDASKVHLAGVQQLFVERLEPDELQELSRLMRKLDLDPASEQATGPICGLD